MSKYLVSAFSLLLAASLTMVAVGEKKDKEAKFEPKCPVSGKKADTTVFVKFNGGKVYFCCQGCPSEFENATDKYAAKANHQLAGTGQAKEVKCPLTGRKLNPSTAIKVSGVKVAFCCAGCKGKASKLEGNAQVNLIFNQKAFEKGFKVAKKGDKK